MFLVGRIAERSQLSASEYLEWEKHQSRPHEFFRGDVFARAGCSPRHNALCSRVNASLRLALGQRGCEVFSSDQRIGIGPGER
jgi:hypothetical protein